MPTIDGVFIGLGDKMILINMERLEEDFLHGKLPLEKLREEMTKFHAMAVHEKVKKIILMEFDGLEIGAKRSVT